MSSRLIEMHCSHLQHLKIGRQVSTPESFFEIRSLTFTLVIILVINFLHQFVFNIGTFYLALYFQVRLQFRYMSAYSF